MKFVELAISDKLYIQELRHLYRSLFLYFLLVFYSASSLVILTPYCFDLLDSAVASLPATMSRQAEQLRLIDGRSHASYIIGIPTALVLGIIFSCKARAMTIGLKQRNPDDSLTVITPRNESIALAVLLMVLMLVIFFSGTISTGRTSSMRGGWLLWPISGLIYFSAASILVTTVSAIVVRQNFGTSKN
jgi:cytochrome bd-type quinol oxidase subunit 1